LWRPFIPKDGGSQLDTALESDHLSQKLPIEREPVVSDPVQLPRHP
jgi:hypothetical protein